MSNENNGEALVQEQLEPGDPLLRWGIHRDPAPADHKNDGSTIGVCFRLQDIEGQGETVFMPVDHVRNNLNIGCGCNSRSQTESHSTNQQKRTHNYCHVPLSSVSSIQFLSDRKIEARKPDLEQWNVLFFVLHFSV